jgi:hypothetical protein
MAAVSSDRDLAVVTSKLNRLRVGDKFEIQDIHPALDQANLWVRVSDIEAIVAWHDRFWPERPALELPEPIGFERRETGAA